MEIIIKHLKSFLAKDRLVPSVFGFKVRLKCVSSVMIADVSVAAHHIRNYFWPKRVICRSVGVRGRSTRLRV